MHINQVEYNKAIKKATRYFKRHPKDTVEIGKKFSAEMGGWNFIGAQFMCASAVIIVLLIFAVINQFYSFSVYLDNYKDLCVGIFADAFIIVFFTIYSKGFIGELILLSGWKNKVSYSFRAFDGSKTKNFLIHTLSAIIIISAFKHYFSNEFSGLFNPICRRIIGLIYILYMTDIINILKRLIVKVQEKFDI